MAAVLESTLWQGISKAILLDPIAEATARTALVLPIFLAISLYESTLEYGILSKAFQTLIWKFVPCTYKSKSYICKN